MLLLIVVIDFWLYSDSLINMVYRMGEQRSVQHQSQRSDGSARRSRFRRVCRRADSGADSSSPSSAASARARDKRQATGA